MIVLPVFRKSSEKTQETNRSKIELITSSLIQEAKSELQTLFEGAIKDKSSSTNPIGLDEAKGNVVNLIKRTMSFRRLLPERIAKSVLESSQGEYDDKLEEIREKTAYVESIKKKMIDAREHYETVKAVYKNVVGKMYVAEYAPKVSEEKRYTEKDTWSDMNEELTQ
jgi:N-acetylglucosamine kinase-like BadF-type ATPase